MAGGACRTSLARHMRRHGIKGRTVELKVRFADFKRPISRSLTLAEPTNITQELLEAGVELLTTRLPPGHRSRAAPGVRRQRSR